MKKGAEESITTSIALTATLNENPNASVEFLITAAIVTGYGVETPEGYADFAITAPGGAWGNVQKIRLEIIREPATLAILGLGSMFFCGNAA